MTEYRMRTRVYPPLVLLLVVGAMVAMVSCGSGGGSSNGGLCEQCGADPDGPCQPSVEVVPGPDEPAPCNVASAPNPCTVELICRRKVDSAQQRCFPKDPNTDEVNLLFRCDGSRPGGTPGPQATPTLTPTSQATAAQTCGNGVKEGTEQCDTTDLGGQTCETEGCNLGGILSCRVNCTFNFDLCTGCSG